MFLCSESVNHCDHIEENIECPNDHERVTRIHISGKMITLRMMGHQHICHE